MNLRPLFSILAWVSAAVTTCVAAEREFKQTFAVQPGSRVVIDSYRGAIIVSESETETSDVKVSLHMEIGADTEEEADRLRDALQLESKLENNVITLRARNPRETRMRFIWNDKYQMELTWRITVPRQCHIDARVINGSITVGHIVGDIKASVEKGSINLKTIDGAIEADTTLGDVVISRCAGSVKARVLKGFIRTGSLFGPADLKNTTGDVEVLAAYSNLRVHAEAGEATIGFPAERKGEAVVTTSGGSILAKIAPTSNCTIEASAIFGKIESRLPLTVTSGAVGRRSLGARLGEGGAPITLRASGGSVRLVPSDAFFTPSGN
jgi:DUF4097 and DUF4098 domain-containing protein YvlB